MAHKITVSDSLWERAQEMAPQLNQISMVRAACGGTVRSSDVLRIAMERGLEVLADEGLTGPIARATVPSAGFSSDQQAEEGSRGSRQRDSSTRAVDEP